MSRKRSVNKTGRGSNALSDFVALERYIMRSPAWRSLSPTVMAVYFELAYRFNGTNNGAILLSTKMLGEALHISKATASRCLKNLMRKGFIEQTKGAGFNCKVRHCSEWRLTAFRCDKTGALPSKTFMRWQPEIQNTVSSRNVTVSLQTPTRKRSTEKPCDGFSTDTVKPILAQSTVSPQNPFYNSNHAGVATNTAVSDGAGKPMARVLSDDVIINNSDDTFQIFGAVALKSLAQLEALLPDELKSWSPIPLKQNLADAA